MHQPPGRVLIERERIAMRVAELGAQLAGDLQRDLEAEGDGLATPNRVVLVPVLTGAVIFLADLVRQMPLNMSMRMISVSSYPGATTESKGARLQDALPPDLAGKHVVIVDDILDTGQTLNLLQRMIAEQKPASLRTCVLLRKDCTRLAPADAEYIGFDIPPEFVIGYGLDYDGQHRNLPDICVLDPAGAEPG
ncbi:MAG: phosphoribosyltransferase [Phycisphaerales bacterium]